MRVLTVRQPWAWAIIHGGKSVENRTRSLGPYRGLVAIHAGLTYEKGTSAGRALSKAHGTEVPTELQFGAVIGVVDLEDAHLSRRSRTVSHMGEPVCFDGTTPTGQLCNPWAAPDHHHLMLSNPRPLTRPAPAKGLLGLWRPDTDLEAVILAQLGGAP